MTRCKAPLIIDLQQEQTKEASFDLLLASMRISVIYCIITLLWQQCIATVIGVDYGQQNVKAMVVSPKAPMDLVLTPESKRKDVSGLAIRRLGDGIERLYGSAVGSLATRFPKNSLLHLKPLLGKTEADETDVLLYLRSHPGVEIKNTDRGTLAISVDGEDYGIEELCAMNIQEIINRAGRLLREKDSLNLDPVNKLAITVPDHFDQHQRQAVLDAGSLTIEDTCLVSDGLSVMMNFAFKQRDFTQGEKHYYIVYDMGAGSTRASLFSVLQPLNESDPLQIEYGGFGYDEYLGGSKFTLDVASIIESKFLESHKNIRTALLHSNPNAIAKIVQAAEKAKLVLSANSEASVSIESLIDEIDFKTKITRQEFEEFIQDSTADMFQPIESALDSQMWQSLITVKDIHGVILTGGSSRVPIVQQKLASILGDDKLLKSVNADEAAVNGATVRAVKLFDAFKTKPVDIIERSPTEFAVKLMDVEDVEIVFQRGSTYPTKKVVQITETRDKPKPFTVDLFENGRIIQTITLSPGSLGKSIAGDTCVGAIVYNVTFSLTQNRLFELEKAEVICVDEKSAHEEDSSTKNSKKNSRIGWLELSKKDLPLTHLSQGDKTLLRERIRMLNQQDQDRFEFEEAKNQLEGLLYEVRGLIEAEDVLENGPKVHLNKLAHIIPRYLEWLEDESDGANKIDILSKIAEINDLKAKVEIYVESSSEPLDVHQFKRMLKRADELIKELEDAKEVTHGGLASINETFNQAGYNSQQEFAKINLPHYISNPLSGWQDKLKTLKGVVKSVDELVSVGSVDKRSREDLFELKLAFDEACIEVDEKIKLFNKARDYQFRELLSWYQRAEKAKKRREEKLKKSIEEQKSANLSSSAFEEVSSSTTISSLLSSTTFPASTTVEVDASVTTTTTVETIIHDEL